MPEGVCLKALRGPGLFDRSDGTRVDYVSVEAVCRSNWNGRVIRARTVVFEDIQCTEYRRGKSLLSRI